MHKAEMCVPLWDTVLYIAFIIFYEEEYHSGLVPGGGTGSN